MNWWNQGTCFRKKMDKCGTFNTKAPAEKCRIYFKAQDCGPAHGGFNLCYVEGVDPQGGDLNPWLDKNCPSWAAARDKAKNTLKDPKNCVLFMGKNVIHKKITSTKIGKGYGGSFFLGTRIDQGQAKTQPPASNPATQKVGETGIFELQHFDFPGGDVGNTKITTIADARKLAQEYIKTPNDCMNWWNQGTCYKKKIDKCAKVGANQHTQNCKMYFQAKDCGPAHGGFRLCYKEGIDPQCGDITPWLDQNCSGWEAAR